MSLLSLNNLVINLAAMECHKVYEQSYFCIFYLLTE